MAYIYDADIYCDDCGGAIRRRLRSSGKAPANPADVMSYDSDRYPKWGPNDDETDSPQHCGNGPNCLNAETLPSGRKIGCLIGTSLTSDGVEYVKEAMAAGGLDQEVADFWRERFASVIDLGR